MEDDARRVTKLKRGKNHTRIEWEVVKPAGTDTYVMSCVDEPRPEMGQALQAMVPHLLALLELPPAYARGVTVTGVTWTFPDEGEDGAVIVAQKALAGLDGAVFNLVSPHVTRATVDGNVFDELSAVRDEALFYLDGDRAQRSLLSCVEALRPGADSSIESVTISSGGRSVTLDKKQPESN